MRKVLVTAAVVDTCGTRCFSTDQLMSSGDCFAVCIGKGLTATNCKKQCDHEKTTCYEKCVASGKSPAMCKSGC